MTVRRYAARLVLAASVLATGCVADNRESASQGDDAFSSGVATLLDFDFDGELTSTSGTNLAGQVRGQMLFMVGHINGDLGVARLDKLSLSNTSSAYVGAGLYRVRYHAKIPVAWGHKTSVPPSYTLTLPRRVDQPGEQAFMTSYSASCNDGEGAAITLANFWYHYRPHAAGCQLAAADVMTTTATTHVSALNTNGKYPEYDKVWEDGALNVVAVFGKYAAGATTDADAGVAGYHQFVLAVRNELGGAVETGTDPDITFAKTLDDGRTVSVVALLVDNVGAAPPSFDRRYSELTPGADIIAYNGHAGLGANVRALAQKGKFFPGKYQLFFMNGCDTFAYVDGALAKTRAALNPDDPTGTKYMEIMTNAMPAYFSSMPDASMSLVRAMLNDSAPETYEEIFRNVDPAQIVVVTGEEDNVFVPGTPPKWNALAATGQAGKHEAFSYESDVLAPGKYVIQMTPDWAVPGGDADLRVHVGSAPAPWPSMANRCPSYVANSNERCTVVLAAPAKIYFSVTGDSYSTTRYVVRGFQP